MEDLIQIQTAGDIAPESEDAALLNVTNELLLDARLSVLNEKTMSVPIAELARLASTATIPVPLPARLHVLHTLPSRVT